MKQDIRLSLCATVALIILQACYTPKNIVKNNRELTKKDLVKIQPGLRYVFLTKENLKIVLKVTKVENNTIYGNAYSLDANGNGYKHDFADTYDNILNNVLQISEVKFNAPLTILALSPVWGLGVFYILWVEGALPD